MANMNIVAANPNGISLPLSLLVHENLSIIMSFVYSRKPLSEMVERRFMGHWKYLEKALFEIAEKRAEKACMELALFLRMLDDQHKISSYHKATHYTPDCGKLIMKDGTEEILSFREVANKLIHSSRLEWEFSEHSEDPLLICHTRDEEKWVRAEINILGLASVCGGLMS
jgi:hypothetical protein